MDDILDLKVVGQGGARREDESHRVGEFGVGGGANFDGGKVLRRPEAAKKSEI